MKDYDACIENKLDQIADTVNKLDGTVDRLQETDGRIMAYFEQQKGLHEIRKILRKTDDIEDLERDKASAAVENIGIADYDQDKAMDHINSALMRLDDTLDNMADAENKVKSYVEQKKALHEIKRVLHLAGKYDNYSDSELAGLETIEQ